MTLHAALRLTALLAALLAPDAARAHAVNFAVAFLRVVGTDVQVTLAITSSDVDRAAGVNVTDHGSGMVDPQKLTAAEGRLQHYYAARTNVTAAGAACTASGPPLVSADSDGGISVQMSFACPHGSEIVYRSTAMLDFDAAARQSVQLMRGAIADEVAVLDAARNAVALTRPVGTATTRLAETPLVVPAPVATGTELRALPAVTAPPPAVELVAPSSRWGIALRYLELGVEHIFLGYDHIAFLVAVLLWARRLATLVRIVTAFTLAHSITLSLAALDILVVPPAIVEPAIAASIVFVAAENFLSRDVERRWIWTGALGLVHGFGFAGVLRDSGLPQQAIVPALAAFNVGVELGQLAIVGVLLAMLLLVDRLMAHGGPPARPPAIVYGASAVIAALGLWWFLERVS